MSRPTLRQEAKDLVRAYEQAHPRQGQADLVYQLWVSRLIAKLQRELSNALDERDRMAQASPGGAAVVVCGERGGAA